VGLTAPEHLCSLTGSQDFGKGTEFKFVHEGRISLLKLPPNFRWKVTLLHNLLKEKKTTEGEC